MSEPTAAVLRECASQLRDLARKHRTSAHESAGLLTGCMALTGDDTWPGPFATETDHSLGSWSLVLDTDAGRMRDDARQWDRAADEFDVQADAADKKAAADSSATTAQH